MSPRIRRTDTLGATWLVVVAVLIVIPIAILLALRNRNTTPVTPPVDQLFSGLISVPKVDSVRVPGPVYATPRSRFVLEALAKGYLGRNVPLSLFPEITIKWSASPGIFIDDAVNPVEVVIPGNSDSVITVTAAVTVSETGEAPYTKASPPQTLHISSPPTTVDASDWLFVEYLPGNAPAAALIRGMDGATKVLDWPVAVVDAVRLGRNVSGGTSELAVFSQDRGAVLVPSKKGGAGPFTSAPDQVKEDPLPAWGSRSVPVRFGVGPTDTVTEALAKRDLAFADAVLNANRVGIRLTWDGYFVYDRSDGEGNSLPIPDPTATCDTVNLDQMVAPASVLRDLTVFVLFVPSIGTDVRGWTCEAGADWVGRAVFLSEDEYTGTTLAHEMGHVLALNSTWLPYYGHTFEIDGFDRSNLMQSENGLWERVSRDRLTLGQIYRMNAQEGSWLNGYVADPVERACTDDAKSSEPCPVLTTDLGGPWP